MEKPDYRAHIERLSERFPGRELITLRDAAAYIGIDPRTLLRSRTFPLKEMGTGKRVAYYVPIVGLARWLSC